MNTVKILAPAVALCLAVLLPASAGAQDHVSPEDHGTNHDVEGIDISEGLVARFRLLGKNGDSATETNFLGQYVLIGFGFTNCPHICPMMAATMGRVLKSTDKDAVGIFISVDTERDTPAITHDYATGFDDRMIGLSGDYNQVAEAAKNFRVTYSVSKSPDNYTVQHTTNTYLLGPDGDLLEIFSLNSTPAEILAALGEDGSP